MRKRQRLGQHFLISQSIAKKIVSAANITIKDTILEIGTGQGILIPYLCKNAKKVISIESDKTLYENAKMNFINFPNLILKNGNGFKTSDKFSLFVSNLPYSQSRLALEWLIQKNFSRAIIMVQKEFAEKLLTSDKKRRSITILVNYALKMEPLMNVKKTNFKPPPKVDSTVLKLTRKKTISKELIKTVNQLFSYRRKKLKNVLKQFGTFIESDSRIEEIPGDEIIKIAKQIIKK